jgi:signal transduction histidine kinase
MRKVALIFMLAVIGPSLVLAWLAVRSLRDQELALERQRTLLYQTVADDVTKQIQSVVNDQQRAFQLQVAALLRDRSPYVLANEFDTRLRQRWPLAEVGFAVSLDGQVLAPSPFAGTEARRFRVENDRFLCSRESVEVYWNGPKGAVNLSKLDQKDAMNEATKGKAVRTVAPEKETSAEAYASKATPEEAAFRQIIGESESGALARFLQDKLNLLFWYRAPRDTQLVFGAQIDLNRLADHVREIVPVASPYAQEICVAVLDDTGRPIALSQENFRPGRQPRSLLGRSGNSQIDMHSPNVHVNAAPAPRLVMPPPAGFHPDWRRPFVATEIGDVLPHWEVAVYLLNPQKLRQSARTLKLTLGLLISLLVLAIAVGSWLVFSDLKRQLTLARQKTDFVSNVTHELKTPLTSIRMFSEMLAEGRVEDDAKRRQFLGIITAETARLTRLINNVLDFARIERGEKKYQFADCDVIALARETLESYRPHLEAGGFKFTFCLPNEPAIVNGDRDALAQVMVNLLSNAEKYSGEGKEVEARVERKDGTVELAVLDRGIGVPRGCEEKIFEQFYRADDSLASGIQGSGLGLTLARQIARAHRGDVTYVAREGGGSCFVLRLPLKEAPFVA